MECPRPTRSRWAVILLGPVISIAPAVAQKPRLPSLDEILQGLENNLHLYDTSIPSFYCDEHVVSQVFPGSSSQNTVTDSIFRLKRGNTSDNTPTLNESREIKTVNGQPATSQDIDGPIVLSGVFEGGLALVSLDQKACMHYSMERIRSSHPQDPYIIRFTTGDMAKRSEDCLLQEQGKGRALVDPATLQITRMELTVPHHTIHPGNPPTTGEWIISVGYAPIQLSGQTFWMPASITSHTSTGTNGFRPTFWTFKATYRNYHKLEVTSRIVPTDSAKP